MTMKMERICVGKLEAVHLRSVCASNAENSLKSALSLLSGFHPGNFRRAIMIKREKYVIEN